MIELQAEPRQAEPGRSRPRKWTVREYYRMADEGFFRDQRVELIGGEIIRMAPQRDTHAAAIALAARAIERVFGEGCWVRIQLPLHLSPRSEPEPDIAVVPGTPRDYVGTGHPTTALLVVEISDTTLGYDRRRKAGLYAKTGIEDYWILNLPERRLEVLRGIVADATHPFRHRYSQVTHVTAQQTIAPLARPQAAVLVADMLP